MLILHWSTKVSYAYICKVFLNTSTGQRFVFNFVVNVATVLLSESTAQHGDFLNVAGYSNLRKCHYCTKSRNLQRT